MAYTRTTWVDGSEPSITAARLNNIEQGLVDAHAGSLNAGAIGTNELADLAVATGKLANDAVSNAKLRNSAALSVIGRSANSTGDPADITAASDHHVLRRSGSALGFGEVATDGIANDAVSNAKLRNSAGLSVIGRSASTTGDPADITAANDGDVLRRSGSSIGFGQVASAGIADNAIGNTKLRDSGALSVIGRSTNSTGDPADITAASDGQVLRRSGNTLGFGTVTTAGIANTAVTDLKLRLSAGLSVIGRSAVNTGAPGDITASDTYAFLGRTTGTLSFRRIGMYDMPFILLRIDGATGTITVASVGPAASLITSGNRIASGRYEILHSDLGSTAGRFVLAHAFGPAAGNAVYEATYRVADSTTTKTVIHVRDGGNYADVPVTVLLFSSSMT